MYELPVCSNGESEAGWKCPHTQQEEVSGGGEQDCGLDAPVAQKEPEV